MVGIAVFVGNVGYAVGVTVRIHGDDRIGISVSRLEIGQLELRSLYSQRYFFGIRFVVVFVAGIVITEPVRARIYEFALRAADGQPVALVGIVVLQLQLRADVLHEIVFAVDDGRVDVGVSLGRIVVDHAHTVRPDYLGIGLDYRHLGAEVDRIVVGIFARCVDDLDLVGAELRGSAFDRQTRRVVIVVYRDRIAVGNVEHHVIAVVEYVFDGFSVVVRIGLSGIVEIDRRRDHFVNEAVVVEYLVVGRIRRFDKDVIDVHVLYDVVAVRTVVAVILAQIDFHGRLYPVAVDVYVEGAHNVLSAVVEYLRGDVFAYQIFTVDRIQFGRDVDAVFLDNEPERSREVEVVVVVFEQIAGTAAVKRDILPPIGIVILSFGYDLHAVYRNVVGAACVERAVLSSDVGVTEIHRIAETCRIGGHLGKRIVVVAPVCDNDLIESFVIPLSELRIVRHEPLDADIVVAVFYLRIDGLLSGEIVRRAEQYLELITRAEVVADFEVPGQGRGADFFELRIDAHCAVTVALYGGPGVGRAHIAFDRGSVPVDAYVESVGFRDRIGRIEHVACVVLFRKHLGLSARGNYIGKSLSVNCDRGIGHIDSDRYQIDVEVGIIILYGNIVAHSEFRIKTHHLRLVKPLVGYQSDEHRRAVGVACVYRIIAAGNITAQRYPCVLVSRRYLGRRRIYIRLVDEEILHFRSGAADGSVDHHSKRIAVRHISEYKVIGRSHGIERKLYGVHVDGAEHVLAVVRVAESIGQIGAERVRRRYVSDRRGVSVAEIDVLSVAAAVVDLRLRRQIAYTRSGIRLQFYADTDAVDGTYAGTPLIGRRNDDEQRFRCPAAVLDLLGHVGKGGIAVFDPEVIVGDIFRSRRIVTRISVVTHTRQYRSRVVYPRGKRRSGRTYRHFGPVGLGRPDCEGRISPAARRGRFRIVESKRLSACRQIVGLHVVAQIRIVVVDRAGRHGLSVIGVSGRVERTGERSSRGPCAALRLRHLDVDGRRKHGKCERTALRRSRNDPVRIVEIRVDRFSLLRSRREYVSAGIGRFAPIHVGAARRRGPGITSFGHRYVLLRRSQSQRRRTRRRSVIHLGSVVPAADLIRNAVFRHGTEHDFVRRLGAAGTDRIDESAQPVLVIAYLGAYFAGRNADVAEAPHEMSGKVGRYRVVDRTCGDVLDRGHRSIVIGRGVISADRLYPVSSVGNAYLDSVFGIFAGGVNLDPILHVAGVGYTRLGISLGLPVRREQAVVIVRERDGRHRAVICGVDQSAGFVAVSDRPTFGPSLRVIAVVVVYLVAFPGNENALYLRAELADLSAGGHYHVPLAAAAVVDPELTSRDTARESVVSFAHTGIFGSVNRSLDVAGTCEIAVLQHTAASYEEADHTSRDRNAVTPCGVCAALFPTVRSGAYRCAARKIDVCIGYSSVDVDTRESTYDSGVFDRTGVSVGVQHASRARSVDVTCLLSADEVAVHVQTDVGDVAEVGCRNYTERRHVSGAGSGYERVVRIGYARAVLIGHLHVGAVIDREIGYRSSVRADEQTDGIDTVDAHAVRVAARLEIFLYAVVVRIDERITVYRTYARGLRNGKGDRMPVAVEYPAERAYAQIALAADRESYIGGQHAYRIFSVITGGTRMQEPFQIFHGTYRGDRRVGHTPFVAHCLLIGRIDLVGRTYIDAARYRSVRGPYRRPRVARRDRRGRGCREYYTAYTSNDERRGYQPCRYLLAITLFHNLPPYAVTPESAGPAYPK